MVVEVTPLAEELIQRLVLTGDCIVRPIETPLNGRETSIPFDMMMLYGQASPERGAAWETYLNELDKDWD